MKNWSGALAFSERECRRFLKVWMQTLGTPIITSLLYFVIFGGAIGSQIDSVSGVSYILFLIPGLAAMNMISHAFQNTSSSFIIRKFQGTLSIDMIGLPLTPFQIVLGNMSGAILRGILVGAVTLGVARIFVPFDIAHPLLFLFSALAITGIFGVLGTLAGMWAKDFDQISAVLNFILTPLTYLGGVFFSLEMLPEKFQIIALANPIFSLVDLFRFSLLGVSEGNPQVTFAVVLILWIALIWLSTFLFRRGWRVMP